MEEELPAALEAAEQSGNPLAPLRIRNYAAQLRIRLGEDLEAVLPELAETWETVRQDALDDTPDVWGVRRECLRALGKVSFDLRRYRQARHWYQELRDRAREAGDLREEAGARYDLIRVRMAHDAPSERNRREILADLRAALAASVQSGFGYVEGYVRLLLAKLEGGPGAAAHLERSHRLAGELGSARFERRVRLARAVSHLDDDPAEARRLLYEIYDDGLFEPGDPRSLVDGRRDHLHLVWQTHPREEAAAAAERVLAAIEDLRSPQTGLARIEVLAAFSDTYYTLAGRLLQGSTDPGDVRRAFTVLERLRAQELREVLLLAGSSAPQLPPPPPDLLDELEAGLEENEAVITYSLASWKDFYGRFSGGAWVLTSTREGTRTSALEVDREQVELAVRMLMDQKDGRWSTAALVSLYDSLLRPALAELPQRIERLVVNPDGVLHLLPFAALRAAPGEPALAELYEISVEPSAALWLNWKKSRARTGADALVLADPELPVSTAHLGAGGVAARQQRAGLGRLPFARREGRRVVRHLRGASQLLQGAEANERFLKQADLRPWGVLHFATHAVADSERPRRSGILLASGEGEDGWLGPEEIARFDLDGKVIVLSTCNSASGGWFQGEGVMSLARAFFLAGAHAVVGTLRRLPDDEGARFFDDFYRQLSRGLNLRQALASTQRHWAASGRPASIWASVVVLGDADLTPVPGGVARPTHPLVWPAIAAGALLLVWPLAVFIRWKRRRASPRRQ